MGERIVELLIVFLIMVGAGETSHPPSTDDVEGEAATPVRRDSDSDDSDSDSDPEAVRVDPG